MTVVCMLEREENVCLNPDRLDQLFFRLGEQGARNVVCRALEELAIRLSELETEFTDRNLDKVRMGARKLVGIADQIGLESLARVAADVRRCAERKDTVSLAATFFRLLRVGEQSLTAVWDA